MTNPLVSVLLPVYNGSRYLREAVDSVLRQSYANFELIVINDGSTDATHEVMSSYSDPRIRYIRQENCGLSATLNRAISLARGPYLARQDSDDFSYPERLERQVAFLEANPACGMVGTWAEIWKEGTKTSRAHRHPAGNAVLQFLLLFNNPFVHSSIMMRREAVEVVGHYLSDRSRQIPEDYELWSRIARRYQVANLPEALHAYRETGGSICRENWERLMDEVVSVSAGNIGWRTGLSCDDSSVVNLAAVCNVVFRRVSFPLEVDRMKQVFQDCADAIRNAYADETGGLERQIRLKWRFIRMNYYRLILTRVLTGISRRMGGSR